MKGAARLFFGPVYRANMLVDFFQLSKEEKIPTKNICFKPCFKIFFPTTHISQNKRGLRI